MASGGLGSAGGGTSPTNNGTYTGNAATPLTIYRSVGSIKSGGAELDMPTIGTGQIIPYLLGRRLSTHALLLWYGNIKVFYDDAVTETTETDENGNIIVTRSHVYTPKGYKADFQLGLALGPGVALKSIYYKGKKMWEGTLSGTRTEFTLPQNASPIKDIIFRSGNIDQSQDPYLEEMSNETGDTPTPGYVGIAYIILKNVNVDELDSMAFEVERFPNPLTLSTGINQADGNLNIISAAADVITNEWGGCGQSIDKIDLASFRAAAAAVPAATNGCAIINDSLVTGIDLLEILMYQCRGFLSINPETGKYQIKLITFPVTASGDNWLFDSDVTDMNSMSKPAWLAVAPHVSLEYIDRSLNYVSIPAVGKNPNSREGSNSTISISMPAVMDKVNAYNLLAREMAFLTTPAQTVTITANRNAADVLPGDIAVLVMAQYDFKSVPMIVEKRRTHPIDSEKVTVVGTVYPYSTLIALYGSDDGFFESFDPNPYPPIRVELRDLPFAFNYGPYVTNNYRKFDNPPGSYPYIYAQAYNKNQVGYFPNQGNTGSVLTPAYPQPVNIWRDMRGGGLASWKDPAYPLFGNLSVALSKYTAWTGGRITLTFDNVVTNKSDADVARASGFILIDDELFMFDPIAMGSVITFDRKLKKLTITNIARCMIDSVAADHAAAAEAFFLDTMSYQASVAASEININRLSDPVVAGAHLAYEIRSYGSALVFGQLRYSGPDGYFSTPASSYTASDRYLRPYRPHNTKINDVRQTSAIPVVIGASVTVSWNPRSRLSYPLTDIGGLTSAYQTQIANYYEQTDPSTTGRLPETGSDGMTNKYRVWIKDSAGVNHDCGYTTPSDLLATSYTFTLPSMATGSGTLWVDAEFLQNGVLQVSKYKDTVAVTVTA